MVPKIARPGKDFIDIHRYLFFDPETGRKSDRVDFTATRNIPTPDTETACLEMLKTALDQRKIKIAAGTDLRGRKLKTFFSHLILSWHRRDDPSQEDMLKAADETIKMLKAQDYQVFIVAHNDKTHKHLHIIINRVHPVTGKALHFSHSKRKLSLWAEGYEKRQGQIRCPARVRNNRKRRELAELRKTNPLAAKGRIVRAYDSVVQAAWDRTDNGKEFAAFLSDKGYVLATGERKRKDGQICRFVVIDPYGKTIRLARHITGENGKNIGVAALRERLQDLQPYALPTATIARLNRTDLLYDERVDRQRSDMVRKGRVPCPIAANYNAVAAPPRKKRKQQKQKGTQSGGNQALKLEFLYGGSASSKHAANENDLDSIQQAQPRPEPVQAFKPQQKHQIEHVPVPGL